MALATMNEALDNELELLTASYPEVVLRGEEGVIVVEVLCRPRTGGREEDFVQTTVQLTLDATAYPRKPPRFHIPQASGLDDAELSTLSDAVNTLIQDLTGDASTDEACTDSLTCLSVLDAVQDMLDQFNAKAVCSICLQPLFPADAQGRTGSPTEADQPLRTPCFHSFHTGCLAEWWVRILHEHSKAEGTQGPEVWDGKIKSLQEVLRKRRAEREEAKAATSELQGAVYKMRVALEKDHDYDSYTALKAQLTALEDRWAMEMRTLSSAEQKLAQTRRELESCDKARRAALEAMEMGPRSIPCPVCKRELKMDEMPSGLGPVMEAMQSEKSHTLAPEAPSTDEMRACMDGMSDEVKMYIEGFRQQMQHLEEAARQRRERPADAALLQGAEHDVDAHGVDRDGNDGYDGNAAGGGGGSSERGGRGGESRRGGGGGGGGSERGGGGGGDSSRGARTARPDRRERAWTATSTVDHTSTIQHGHEDTYGDDRAMGGRGRGTRRHRRGRGESQHGGRDGEGRASGGGGSLAAAESFAGAGGNGGGGGISGGDGGDSRANHAVVDGSEGGPNPRADGGVHGASRGRGRHQRSHSSSSEVHHHARQHAPYESHDAQPHPSHLSRGGGRGSRGEHIGNHGGRSGGEKHGGGGGYGDSGSVCADRIRLRISSDGGGRSDTRITDSNLGLDTRRTRAVHQRSRSGHDVAGQPPDGRLFHNRSVGSSDGAGGVRYGSKHRDGGGDGGGGHGKGGSGTGGGDGGGSESGHRRGGRGRDRQRDTKVGVQHGGEDGAAASGPQVPP